MSTSLVWQLKLGIFYAFNVRRVHETSQNIIFWCIVEVDPRWRQRRTCLEETRQILEDGSRETVVPPCLALASASSSSHSVTISKTSSQRWKTILRRCFHFTVINPRFPKKQLIDFLHDLFPFQGTVLVTEADQWKQYWSTFESYASSLNQSCHILAISFRSLPLPSTSDTADIVARYTCT